MNIQKAKQQVQWKEDPEDQSGREMSLEVLIMIILQLERDERLIALKRRRTQVKLAQRAYRQRKDDTLAALKKQCGDLEEVIRNINEAFNAFYSDSCHSGIGSREPKHMYHLRQTAKYMGDLTDIAIGKASKRVSERDNMSNRASLNSPFKQRPSHEQRSFQPGPLSYQATNDGLSANWIASLTAGIPELCISGTGGGVIEAMDPLNDLLCPSPMLDLTYLTSHTNTAERATFARRLQHDALERGFELSVAEKRSPIAYEYY
ncbi:hypothetical protein N7494_012964 [Penicillium frequentans]|uniref:BZIP domain-containing protein n=1 Tax=Penicillium frequentans TaxID=3151616 RepID=A0AAD6CMM9_9EURO|nr:hypothetical protein N7494_012964 [Penicillium glabrum]